MLAGCQLEVANDTERSCHVSSWKRCFLRLNSSGVLPFPGTDTLSWQQDNEYDLNEINAWVGAEALHLSERDELSAYRNSRIISSILRLLRARIKI